MDKKENVDFKYIDDYYDNFAVVQRKDSNFYQYMDKNGNLSEEFYEAKRYREGFAIVIKVKDGPYQFRDKQGNLSEEFHIAFPYFDGCSVVHKYENGPCQLRNVDGQLSKQTFDSYEDAYDYRNAYPQEITYHKTSIALKLKSADSIFSLTPEEIVENAYEIKQFLNAEYKKAIKKCTTPQEINSIINSFKSKAEFIRKVTFEEYQKNKSINAIKKESENINLF